MNYECLNEIKKEDVEQMSFEELKLLAERISREQWAAKVKQEILSILDVRDAQHDPKIIDVDFTPKEGK
jgi:hypothetical protein